MENSSSFKYKASIIVVSYNQRQFIAETLASIEAQDFESLQLILGDDASTDGTQDLINEHLKTSRFTFVKIFNQQNLGISKNLNNCLRACEGQYIFLLGGDDLFVSGKLARQVAFMDENPEVVLSFHDAQVFDSKTGLNIFKYSELFNVDKFDVEGLVLHGTFFTGSTPCIRRFTNIPFFNEKISFSSDWLWYIEVLLLSKGRMGQVEGVLSKYRRHPDNVTSSKNYIRAYCETFHTLCYLSETYPCLRKVASMALAERQFAYCLKGFFAGRLYWAFKLFVKAIVAYPLAPLLFLKLRASGVMARLSIKL